MMHCEYNVNGSSYCLAIWVWCVLLIFGWLYACCQEVLMLDWIVNFGAGFAEGGECQGDKQGSTFGESFAGEGTAQLPPPLLCRCTLHSGQAFFLNVDMSIYISISMYIYIYIYMKRIVQPQQEHEKLNLCIWNNFSE